MTSLPGRFSNSSSDFSKISNSITKNVEPNLSTENAINFFGLADKDDAEVLADKAIECAQSFKFEGYITKNNGVGRSSSDRQFFYINKRPVDMPFLARILNSGQAMATTFSTLFTEMEGSSLICDVFLPRLVLEWRKITSKRYPACCINLTVEQKSVDINLAPDKRTVLLKNRKYAEFSFKFMLEEHWGVGKDSNFGEVRGFTQNR